MKVTRDCTRTREAGGLYVGDVMVDAISSSGRLLMMQAGVGVCRRVKMFFCRVRATVRHVAFVRGRWNGCGGLS